MRGAKSTLKTIALLAILLIAGIGASKADTIAINNLGHSSVYFEYNNLVIYVDPYSAVANFDTLPRADYIFVTHEHPDHYDLTALNKIKKAGTVLVTTQTVKNLGTYHDSIYVMKNGDSLTFKGIKVKAVPAYNIVNTTYHPKGVGNGYVFTFGEKKIYVAGDSEHIPEMRMMGPIDVAFLPMNIPYTMTPLEASNAALNINPHILYIYHYEKSDTALVRKLLRNYIDIIRIGKSVYYENDQKDKTPNENVLGNEARLVFYPNPVKDFLIITNMKPGSQVSLFDLAGKLLLKQQLSGQGEQRLNLSKLEKGAYLLKYQQGRAVTSQLILKE
ncbi:MAG: MBL fold metallo-hydrolase [Candidatus Saccharibacteria bacterium]